MACLFSLSSVCLRKASPDLRREEKGPLHLKKKHFKDSYRLTWWTRDSSEGAWVILQIFRGPGFRVAWLRVESCRVVSYEV